MLSFGNNFEPHKRFYVTFDMRRVFFFIAIILPIIIDVMLFNHYKY